MAESRSSPSVCGENLEYTPEFIALQHSAVGKGEQQFGSLIVPAEAPDWRAIERDAQSLLARSRDIRVMYLLAWAWTELEGLEGYARGIDMLVTVLEQHWNEVHPTLTCSGDSDPMIRMNAVAAFADAATIGRSLRMAPILAGAAGELSLREAISVLEAGESGDASIYPGGNARLRLEFASASAQGSDPLARIQRILNDINRLRQVLEAQLDSTWIPSFGAIVQPLTSVFAAVSVRKGLTEIGGQSLLGGGTAEAAVDASMLAAPRLVGDMDGMGRSQVVRALQEACAYLERTEPSHPAPLLIRRSIHLLQMNFMEIINELIPDGVAQVAAIAGTSQQRKAP